MTKKSYTPGQLIQNTSFRNWVKGRLEDKEARDWDEWAEADERNREMAREAMEQISEFSFKEPELPSVEREWDKVQHRLKVETGRKKFGSKWYQNFKWMLRAAAVLFIALSVSWLIVPNSVLEQINAKENPLQTKQADIGGNKIINLTDGSSVILSPGSKVFYQDNWLTKPTKHISLEGEAYFSITPDETKGYPKFVIETEDGTTSVWGTKFTISTYGEGTQVVLEEGMVQINVAGLRDDKENLEMTPGQLANFKRSERSISVREVNPRVYTSWTTDRLLFDNTPISHLFDRLERTYGVEIKIKDSGILNRKLSGSVNFKDLDSLIQAISEVLKIDITRTGRTVFIYGDKKN